MANWTVEQKAAIELRDSDILVSAAAGSGKTAVLVERITQMLIKGESDVDRLLIVTYTNAAAGEMRSRIESALSEAIEKNPAEGRHLNNQIKMLNRASIKTFHAFCLDVIRSHFLKVDLDPSFKMIRDSERLILMEQALDETMEAAYESMNETFENLVESYTDNRDDQKLRQMINQLYGFSMSQPYPEKWLETQPDVYSDENHPLRGTWQKFMLSTFSEWIEGALDLIDKGLDLCNQPGGPLPYVKTLNEDKEQFVKLMEATDIGLEALEKTLAETKLGRIASIKKADKEAFDENLIVEVKDVIRNKMLKKQILEKIQKIFDYKSTRMYFDELSELSDRIEYLIRLVLEFSTRFTQLKKEKNVLDFNDLEHYAVKILEDPTVCNVFREKFNFIFVDEYQDASAIQETIIKRICRPGNLFMVGDVKQSIYKFRLADPELFLEKYKSFAVFDEDTKTSSSQPKQLRVDLKNNFRTRTDILDQVNSIFEIIMSEKLGDVTYDQHAKLYGLMPFEPSTHPYVEMNLLTKKPLEEESDATDSVSELKTEEMEARAIATKIKSLIGSRVYFPKSGEFRSCTYKDIVILLRSSKSWIPTFEEVFNEMGIPFYADSQSGYFDTLEIKLIVELLRIIDNPYQDLSLLTVLRSPIVGLNLEDLVALKLSDQESRLYFDKLKKLPTDASSLSRKIQSFLTRLEDWRRKASYLPLDELIWYVVKSSDFYSIISAMPGGVSRQANVKLLIDRANDLKNSKLFSLSHFVTFIDQMGKTSGDMGVANSIGEDEDVVRLMSIHKSKGLEFPIVIIGGLGKKFNLMDTYGDMVPHKQLGIGFSYVNPTLRIKSKTFPQHVIKEAMRRETLSEEMRVLYVGLTRPVDRLILFGTVNDYSSKELLWNSKVDTFMLTNANTYLDWLMPSILNYTDIQTNIVSEVGLMESTLEVSSKGDNRVDFLRKAAAKSMDHVAPQIKERLSFVYPGVTSDFKPLKVSVTELKNKERKHLPDLIEAPEFLRKDKPLTGADKGTAMHKILEKINFHTQYSKEKLSEMVRNSKILTNEEKESIDYEKILSFLNSNLGIRLSKSKSVHKETPFVVIEDGQLVQGIIDLFFEEEDGYVLIDYKTDFVGRSSLDEVSGRYKEQLAYYRTAIEKITGRKVKETYLYFFDVNCFHQL